MNTLIDFERNVTFFANYDENSFIGKWLDECIWCDDEYVKLEQALKQIQKSYLYPSDLPRDLLCGLYRIIELMMVPNWLDFAIEQSTKNTKENINTDIFDRFERLKVILSCVFNGDDMDNLAFNYNP